VRELAEIASDPDAIELSIATTLKRCSASLLSGWMTRIWLPT
jgi:hypothetical protein